MYWGAAGRARNLWIKMTELHRLTPIYLPFMLHLMLTVTYVTYMD